MHCNLKPFLWLVCLVGFALPSPAAEPKLELRQGDHISIIGNTMADRMQHSGWLETYIHATYPTLDLTFRNLGFSGDELKVRPREENFGSPDQWLTKTEANVIFCFFGYNEALKGPGQLDAFRRDLTETIQGMLAQKYDGKNAPRLVFFSPIAHENLNSPHLPDGSANNQNLELYTAAMADVCQKQQVAFVDLFHPTQSLYAQSSEPLTLNGIHLLDDGERAVAGVIMKDLFGVDAISKPEAELQRLRQAILDRNYYWFSRYRVVDGYNVFGGRSKLAWFGQSNADVMMREMEIFDVMTANRDARVWAVARGSDLKVVDDNLPPELEVKTNIPGSLPDGKHVYLGGKEAISKMKIAEGMQVNLFASEEMFPEIVNPVQMAVDPDGKLFVSVWPSYPHWNPTEPRRDKIVCLHDDNLDGVADRCTTFADELNSVTGFEFWNGGMLVAALPEIWFLKDTDGDGKADYKQRMLQGVCSADSHHSANAMLIGPDGWLYWSRGIFNVAAMETPTKTVRSGASGVHRFNPRTFEMEFHFPIGPNPHGDVFDQWGYQFANDGTGGTGSYVNIGKGVGNKQWFKMRVRPVAATGLLSSSHFPEQNQGNFLICNCIGFLGVLQHEIKYNGADITAEEIEPILVSSDPNFRPTDVEIGGDGALYVSDWSNAIIGHMQHNMRDPNRDHEHGRIYRVTAKDRPLLKPVKLIGKPIAEVCQAFYGKENGTRYRARLELSGRDSGDVTSYLNQWTSQLNPKQPADAQAMLESLWTYEEHRVPNFDLINRLQTADEPRVRAAAVRTLGHWAQRAEAEGQWVPVLLGAARDDSALVRAEAVKSAVNFTGQMVAEVIFEVAIRPQDPELETVLKYARGQVDVNRLLREAIQAGRPLSDAALQYALQNADVQDLAKLPRTEPVCEAMLTRTNASTEILRDALTSLATLRKTSSLPLMLKLMEERDAAGQADTLGGLTQLLVEQPASELKPFQNQIKQLALEAKQAPTRRLAFAAWMLADPKSDAAYMAATKQMQSLRDWLMAIALVKDEVLKQHLYPLVSSLAFELPSGLNKADQALTQSGIKVDYYSPNPPNVALETLAGLTPQASGIATEITMNVPQCLTRDAFALRFTGVIDVPVSGDYTFFVASDDGSRLYVDDQLLINNDALQGMNELSGAVKLLAGPHRLAVTYFDNGGNDGFEVAWAGPNFAKRKIAPESLFTSEDTGSIHDVAIAVLASLPGHEADKFNDLSALMKAGKSPEATITALQTLPESAWSAKALPGLVDQLVGYLTSLPASLRTSGAAVTATTLAKSMSSKLPKEQADAIANRLQNLDVRVIAIGTVEERMIYDKESIVVEAGKPVEFRFSNTDNMPHNFAIVAIGALEEIGLLSDSTAQDADAKDRHFIPKSDKVLVGSRLLAPGESQAIAFDVPKTPGIYPYVCTYPGHWRRMFGALYVVEDLQQYQANPEKYLADHPMEVRDELLNSRGRNTQWKYDDLITDVTKLPAGRSFEVGKSLFKAANCIACHKLGGEGREFGPDIATLDAKRLTPEALLRSLIEPSAEINEKFQSHAFVLSSGSVVTGMIVGETPDSYQVLSDPMAKAEPTVIAKDDIDEEAKSTVSIMPQGLLDRLTREEILDLFAYLVAKGSREHALFSGHDHHH